MADVKISGLTAVSAVEANDLLEVSEDTGGGTYASRKATATQIKAFASADSVQKSGDTMTGPLVVNVSSASDALRITQTGSGNAILVEDSANPDATPFVVDAIGNVGIGTSSPGNRLDIVGVSTSQIRVKDGVNAIAYYDFGRDGTDGFFGFSGAQTVFSGYKWSINAGTEVMRITNAGNVGIGTSSPLAANRLTVVGGGVQFSPGTSAQEGVRVQRASGVCTFTGINNDNNAFNALSFSTGASEAAHITTSGDFQFNSGYGSVATAYGCRAWVNFNGTGTVAIRASGNVSSITDGGTGDYTVNFTNAMPDANYSVVCNGQYDNITTTSSNISVSIMRTTNAQVAGSVRIASFATSTGALLDFITVTVAVFR